MEQIKKETIVFASGGALLTFGISKMFGVSTVNAILSAISIGIVVGGVSEYVVQPKLISSSAERQIKFDLNTIENLTDAQAEILANKIHTANKSVNIIRNDVFAIPAMIDALSRSGYKVNEEGKAVKK